MTGILRFQFLPLWLVESTGLSLLWHVLCDGSEDTELINSVCRESGRTTGWLVLSRMEQAELVGLLAALLGSDDESSTTRVREALDAHPSLEIHYLQERSLYHARSLVRQFHLPADDTEDLATLARHEAIRSLFNYIPDKAGLKTFTEACLRMWSLGMRRKLGRKIDREKKFKAAPKPVDGCIVRSLCVRDSAPLQVENAEFFQRWLDGLMAEDRDLLFERHRKSAVMIAVETGHHPATVRKRLSGLRHSYVSSLKEDA